MTPFALDHPAVSAYLQRLDAATAHLPEDERIEIQEGIRSHLIAALAEAHTDADMHQALDALGAPEEIVGAPPAPPQPTVAPAPKRRSARGPMEILAVILLLIGALIGPLLVMALRIDNVPIVIGSGIAGWVLGVVLLWVSRAWRGVEKLLGTFVVPGGLVGAAAGLFGLLTLAAVSCSSGVGIAGTGQEQVVIDECSRMMPLWVAIPLALVCLVGPIVSAIYLLRAAGKRPAPMA